MTFRDETGKEMKYSFEMETVGSLKSVVIRPEETLADSSPVSVAYELNGDSLKIVVASRGTRPTELSDNNNQELILCKRQRE